MKSDILPSTSGVIICANNSDNDNAIAYYRHSQELELVEKIERNDFYSESNFDSGSNEDFKAKKRFAVKVPNNQLLELGIEVCDTAGLNQRKCGDIDADTLSFVDLSDIKICVLDFTDIQYSEQVSYEF